MRNNLFLCIIAFLVISGCVDKIQTQIQAEKDGWNQAKYEEYSKYYDNICITYDRNNQCNPSSKSLYDVKEKLLDISYEGNTFERTWYMVFFNLQNGLEIKSKSDEFICNRYLPKKLFLDPAEPNPDFNTCTKKKNKLSAESRQYISKSLEYRQKIEEMKNLSHTPAMTAKTTPIVAVVVTSSKEDENLTKINNSNQISPEMMVNQLSIDAPAKAMAGYTIKIKVTTGGVIIDGATINIGNENGTTDKNGIFNYTLNRSLKGTYSINASKIGYEKATQNIEIEKYEKYRLIIESPSQAKKFETITIKILYDGTAMSGAVVSFDNWTAGTTDSNGEVTYRLETSGNHSITASKKSYISVSRDIEIRAP